MTADHRPRLSARHDRHRPASLFPRQANGSLIETRRQGHRLGADRPGFHRATATSTAGPRRPPAPIRTTRPRPCRRPTMPPTRRGSNLGPTSEALIDRVQGRRRAAARPRTRRAGSGRPRHHLGQRPRSRTSRPQAALFQVPRVAKARGLPEDRVRALVAGDMSRAGCSASSASRGSMCWRSTWRSTQASDGESCHVQSARRWRRGHATSDRHAEPAGPRPTRLLDSAEQRGRGAG